MYYCAGCDSRNGISPESIGTSLALVVGSSYLTAFIGHAKMKMFFTRFLAAVSAVFITSTAAFAESSAQSIPLGAPVCIDTTRDDCRGPQDLITVKLLALADYGGQCTERDQQEALSLYREILHLTWKKAYAYNPVADHIIRLLEISIHGRGTDGMVGSPAMGIGFAYPPDLRDKFAQTRLNLSAQDVKSLVDLVSVDVRGYRFWFNHGTPKFSMEQCASVGAEVRMLAEDARLKLPPSLPELAFHTKQFDAVWMLARRVGACDDDHRSRWDDFYMTYDIVLRDSNINPIARRQLSLEINEYATLAMFAANGKTMNAEAADCGNVGRDADEFLRRIDVLYKKGTWVPLDTASQ